LEEKKRKRKRKRKKLEDRGGEYLRRDLLLDVGVWAKQPSVERVEVGH
jgi:hypothetical protein